jgi:hypothetical protein
MDMKRSIFVIFGLALGLATSALAQQVPPRAEQPSAAIEPEAVAALGKMGTYLRTLKAFQVRATTTTEEVLEDGQKVQFAAVTDLLARVPDRLRAEVTSDLQHRMYFYDGKTFTLFAQLVGYYATVPAPPTIGELADRLDQKYGIEVPLVDLFRWGGPRSSVADITAGTDIGPSDVGGTTCEHYAFRQAGLDWQIWIQQGDYPLPRKLVLTTLTDEARPQYTSVYTWNLAPSFDDAAFTFDPPSDAQKIAFAEESAAPGAAKK